MKIVIVGCGRVGASIADAYDRSGHEVLVIDSVTAAFDRLPSSFGGTAIRGDGTDEDVLERAGVGGADVFLALTEGDNRNVMSAQLANEALGHREGDRQDQRSAACQGVCRARDRDALPDRPDGRCGRPVSRPPAVGPAWDAGPERAS